MRAGTAKETMNRVARGLRKEGFRVRNGRWPADEWNWDFCLIKDSLFPISEAARKRSKQLVQKSVQSTESEHERLERIEAEYLTPPDCGLSDAEEQAFFKELARAVKRTD